MGYRWVGLYSPSSRPRRREVYASATLRRVLTYGSSYPVDEVDAVYSTGDYNEEILDDGTV